MSEIQQNRYDQLLRRVADLKGPGSKVHDALGELFPVIDVERVPGELLILAKTNICFGGGVIDAAAAQGAKAQLFNPEGSGVLATVTGFTFSSRTIHIIRWGVTQTQFLPVVGTQTFRDTRRTFAGFPVCQISQLSSVVLASGTNQAVSPATAAFQFSDDNGVCVLAPGTGFEMGTDALGQELFYSIYWRERVAEPSELNF